MEKFKVLSLVEHIFSHLAHITEVEKRQIIQSAVFAQLSPDPQEVETYEQEYRIETDNAKAIGILQVFTQKELLLPVHIDFFRTVLSQHSRTTKDLPNSIEETEKEIQAIKVLKVDFSSDNPSVMHCEIKSESQVFQETFKSSISVDCLTQCDYQALQLMVNQTVKINKETPVLAAVSLVKNFLDEKIALQVKQTKKSHTKDQKIPYLPPLHTLTDLQQQTNSLELKSFSMTEIEAQLRHLATNQIKKFSKHYSIIDEEKLMQPEQYKAFIELLKTYNSRKEPGFSVTVGYHGASRSTFECIADDGLLCPGEFNSKGRLIEVVNGSLYGKGIYVSPSLHKASCYSYGNSAGVKQILVSLLAPGKCFPCPCPLYNEESRSYEIYNNGEVKEGYDSHVSPLFDEFVLFDSHQLLPILLLTLSPVDKTKEQYRKREAKKVIVTSKRPAEVEKLSFVEKLDPSNCHLDFTRVPGTESMFLIKLPLQHLQKFSLFTPQQNYIHTIFMLDRSASMGKTFRERLLPSCAELHRSIQPHSADAIFFGSTIDKYSIENDNFFTNTKITNMKLEPATHLLGAYHSAVDCALKKKNKLMKEPNINEREILFIFILLSDGKDTVSPPSAESQILERNQKYLRANQIQNIFKVVGIGKSSDTSLAMRLKVNTETISLFYRVRPIFYARRPSQLLGVCNQLARELREMIESYSGVFLSISDIIPLNGFILNLASSPVSKATCQINGETSGILYQGIPPRVLTVNGFQVSRLLHAPATHYDEIYILQLIKKLVFDIKVAAVAHKPTDEARKMLRAIVTKVKEDSLARADITKMSPQELAEFMKKQKTLIIELETQLNGLDEAAILAESKMNSDQLAKWLNSTSNMKFGAKALMRVQRSGTTVDSESILKDLREKCENSLPLVPRDTRTSVISHKTANTHWEYIEKSITSQNFSGMETTDFLYSFGMIGKSLNVIRSESSNINPWTLIVDYISSDYLDTSVATCLLDSGLPYHDQSKQLAPDVLVIPDPRNPSPYIQFISTKLYSAYLGVVFTRNPEITLPTQQIALAMISFVKSLEQLMNPQNRAPSFIVGVFEMFLYIRNHIKRASSYWESLLKKLYEDNPGMYMTEAEGDDVISVVKILAPLCCSDICSDLFTKEKNSQQLREIALALLAEASSRSCRVIVKREGVYNATDALICKALGINESQIQIPDWNSPVECKFDQLSISNEYSKVSGKKYSSRMFAKSLTNCSPQGVVACLGFARLLFSYTAKHLIEENMCYGDTEALVSYISKGFEQITMKNFVAEFVPHCDPMDLQIGLYVQGLCHHSSKERKKALPSLSDAKPVIQEIATSQRRRIILAALQERFKSMKKELALMQSLEKQRKFLEVHSGAPATFTVKQVAELNQSRDPGDQLEVNETSGLLKHRCCFAKCEEFMIDLRTEEDKKNKKSSNNCLFAHLSLFTTPKRMYTPGFHIMCKTVLQTSTSETKFVHTMSHKLLALRNENLKLWKLCPESEFLCFYNSLLSAYWQQNINPPN